MEQPATSSTKITHVPVHLRSFKLPAPKAAVAPKVTQALAEIGVTYSRLVMPTRDNCNKLDSLLEATTSLIEIKKIVDKVDQDIRMLRARLGLRESEGADGRMKEFSPMHGDEVKDGTEGEVDGRAQSVASTKSARGRKQVRVLQSRVTLLMTAFRSHDAQSLCPRSIHLHLLELAQRDRRETSCWFQQVDSLYHNT